MWDNSSVIDSVGKKIKDDRHFFVSDRSDPRKTPTKSASTIMKITAPKQ